MLLVEIYSGGGWIEIARHVSDNNIYWQHHEIPMEELEAAGVLFSSEMQVRFTANDAYPQSVVEAGVDGFTVTAIECTEPWLCGDMDGSGALPLDVADLVYLVDYMFNGGPAPVAMAAANVDGIGGTQLDIADLVYLVDFMFNGGPPPVC
jgi:hypothetical protein